MKLPQSKDTRRVSLFSQPLDDAARLVATAPVHPDSKAERLTLGDGVSAFIYHTIKDVPQTAWDARARFHSEASSWSFWNVLEQSGLNDFSYHYALLVNQTGQVLAQAGFYDVTTDLAIFGPRWLRRSLAGIRCIWPNFMKLRMLECGTPITLLSPPVTILPGADPALVVTALTRLLRKIARRQKQLLIVIRDFEPPAAPLEVEFAAHGYHLSDNLPNTYLDIRWPSWQGYLQSMRSYYRSKLVKYLKRNEKLGITCTLTSDFADLAETLHRQWMNVHENAKEFQREILTPAFYRELAQQEGVDARVLLFYREKELVGHALLLRDYEELRWLYVGREAICPDGLYLFIAQKVVETAISLGAKRLEMGLTTYPIKQDLGAEIVPLRMALRATNGFLNLFVGLGYKLLNHVSIPSPRQVFKPGDEHES